MVEDWKRHLHALHAELIRRDDPVAWVTEADAVDASQRYPHVALRGPVFGVAAQEPAVGPQWRLLLPVVDWMAQQARDALNSHLWFKAKDEVDDPAERHELLAAVGVLEREPANEVRANGVRYRVVRGDQFARSGKDGLEPPRPTDPEPVDPKWGELRREPFPDEGYVLDPGRDRGLSAAALKVGLRDFAYTGARFPTAVRADSQRAVSTHPDLDLLPVCFGVAERDGGSWSPQGSMMGTPHEARDLLYGAMTETWPMVYRYDDRKKAAYAKAAERFRAAGHANEVSVGAHTYRICRVERLLRCGPDGPESPRPSDVDSYGPMKMHPTMDDSGTIHPD